MTSDPRVFVSYSHDDPDQMSRALRLCEILRAHGVDAQIDRYYETPPPVSWPAWMHDELEQADFVVVVCSETYQRRVLGREAPSVGLGARWEGAIITQEAYEQGSGRFIPVTFGEDARGFIPYFLRGTTNTYSISMNRRDLSPSCGTSSTSPRLCLRS